MSAGGMRAWLVVGLTANAARRHVRTRIGEVVRCYRGWLYGAMVAQRWVRVEDRPSSRFVGRDVVWRMMPPDAACRRGGPTRNEAEE